MASGPLADALRQHDIAEASRRHRQAREAEVRSQLNGRLGALAADFLERMDGVGNPGTMISVFGSGWTFHYVDDTDHARHFTLQPRRRPDLERPRRRFGRRLKPVPSPTQLPTNHDAKAVDDVARQMAEVVRHYGA